MSIRKTLTNLVLLGTLALVGAGCGKENPQDMDIRQILRLREYPKKVPVTNEKNLEGGYIDPAKVEVQIRDQNQDGRYEVIMKYEEQRYLMKYNKEQKKISLVPFEKRIEIIEKDLTPEARTK